VLFFIFRHYFTIALSLLLSLLFLVHPINVEAVAYIASLQTVMSLFFGLLGIALIIKKYMHPALRYSLLSLCMLCSALSKETGLLLIALFPLAMILLTNKQFRKKDYLFISAAILGALLVYLPLKSSFTNTILSSDYSPVPIMNAPLQIRLLTLPKIIFFYLATLLYPQTLAVSQQWLVTTPVLQSFWLPLIIDLLFFLVPISFGWKLLYKKSFHYKTYLFFSLWFVLGWAAHWNIIPLEMTVAERWFYFASPGLLGIFGVMLIHVKIIKRAKLLLVIFCALVLTALAIRTTIRNADWKDEITLYEHDLKTNHESYQLENQLANALLGQGQYDQAKPHILRSIQLAPRFWENWNNLGVYYESKNNIPRSINAFSTALANNPQYRMGYVNLANTLYHYHGAGDAKPVLTKALAHFPHDAVLLSLDAIAAYKLGDSQTALQEIQEAYAVTSNPDFLTLYTLMQEHKSVDNF
jgi:tetratricopeptide (TPR) repeat protein